MRVEGSVFVCTRARAIEEPASCLEVNRFQSGRSGEWLVDCGSFLSGGGVLSEERGVVCLILGLAAGEARDVSQELAGGLRQRQRV